VAKDKKSAFFCQNCGYESPRWMGQCPACRQWNTMVEELMPAKTAAASGPVKKNAPLSLSQVSAEESARMSSGIEELDRVLGGGIVAGSLMLVGGDPGIGKSTLLLQTARLLANEGRDVLYVSGEESARQIKMRSERIGKCSDTLKILCETDIDRITEIVEKEMPKLLIIDSVQTMYTEKAASSPGSVSQVRETTAALLRLAKTTQIPVFIVGHVTKDGNVAGPRVLEHMVDTVLYFEGDRHASYRILRSVKNRFGSTNEIGVFEMADTGLTEVPNPSEYMLEGRPGGVPGSVVACSMEGSRPVMIEIQALVAKSSFNIPRRTANGTDFNRVNMLMAVLEKRGRLPLSSYDAYINITGGIRMTEPAVDLGIVLAIASCMKDFVVPEDTVVFGEVGLSGEVRSVSRASQRISEAAKLGFKKVVLPKSSLRSVRGAADGSIELLPVSNVRELLALF